MLGWVQKANCWGHKRGPTAPAELRGPFGRGMSPQPSLQMRGQGSKERKKHQQEEKHIWFSIGLMRTFAQASEKNKVSRGRTVISETALGKCFHFKVIATPHEKDKNVLS